MSNGRDSAGPRPAGAPTPLHPAIPYLVVLGVTACIGLILAGYLWAQREEIWRIISISPV